MINRRKFLEAGAAVGVGSMLPLKLGHAAEKVSRLGSSAAGAPGGGSPRLEKFVDALPVPSAYTPTVVGGVRFYDIPIGAFSQKLHRDLPATYLWGYGGTFPSRSIEATVGQPVRIRWRNTLKPTDVHPVASAVDYLNVRGMLDPNGNRWPNQRIATHLHGGHVPWTSDGGPKIWYTGPYFGPSGTEVLYDMGPDGYHADTYDYPNNQRASTLWFHDHAMGITRLNVYAGMAGFWILRDPTEKSLNLPADGYEIPIVFQDRTFNTDGSLFYPPPPEVPEFFGDTMVVNGKVWPRLEVEPRKYRFRFLNGCNARFLRMQLIEAAADGSLPSNTRFWNPGPAFNQIGTEGGLMAAPVVIASPTPLLMAPAERADVVIDFSGLAGKHFLLFNDAATPFGNTASTKGAIPEVMLFSVTKPLAGRDKSSLPATLAPFAPLAYDANTYRRFISLDEITVTSPTRMLMQLLNQVGYETDPFNNNAPPPAALLDAPVLGTNEIWEYANTTVDVHPIHIHQAMFQLLDRRTFDVAAYQAARVHGTRLDALPFATSAAVAASGNEVAWKDTIRANPGEITRFVVNWADYPGHYVYHCHILEHEEHDMMRPLEIQPAGSVVV